MFTDTFEGVLGSVPNAICQICHSPGHNAVVVSIRHQPRSANFYPAMASFTPAEPRETLWYPDSAAASHMTPDEGMLSTTTPYLGSIQVEVGMVIYYLLLTLEILVLRLVLGRWNWILCCMFLNPNTIHFLCVVCVMRTIVMFSFLIPSFALRTTPQLKSFYRGLAMAETRTVYPAVSYTHLTLPTKRIV